ncbi:MAG: D-cysteine desulfhydrase [Kiritimatiellae bacterium]|nr:D-cysteine desulfhydrase [Kiritimatiellia bacterium]
MNLAPFPRRRYTEGQTPLERVDRFSDAVGGPRITIKRDDLLGLTGGGNKTRKLEFLVADALAQGADTLITCGGIQSNHCRLTLAAAVKEGMKCRLVLEEHVPGSYDPNASGNNFLYRMLGVEKIVVCPAGTDLMNTMQEQAKELAAQDRKAYVIPVGGSTPLGSLGYVACAQEILAQMFDRGVTFDYVVCASCSAGTHAGLIIGFRGNNSGIPVLGINAAGRKRAQEERVYKLAQQTADLAGLQAPVPRVAVRCFDEYVGSGYSLPTPEMVKAVKLLAQTEGILLDPTYTGKAMAGVIDLARKGYFKKDDNVLFVHTGGSAGLFAATGTFLV